VVVGSVGVLLRDLDAALQRIHGATAERWALAAALVLAGGGIEIVQGFVGREPDWKDWIADMAGIAAVLIPLGVDRLLRRDAAARA